jgi:hypothetical protein
VERGGLTDITCNECGLVLKTVTSGEFRRTLDEMELSLGVASEQCSHCGSVNLFPGFDSMDAYTCRQCGAGVVVSGEVPPGSTMPDFHKFPEGEEIEVQTGISPECQQGNCTLCGGVGDFDGQPVFCIHDCHKATKPN